MRKSFRCRPCSCAFILKGQPLHCPPSGIAEGLSPPLFNNSNALSQEWRSPILSLLCNRLSPSGPSDVTDVTVFVFSPGVKERNSVSPLTDFDIPTSFWYELRSLTEALMDNVKRELLETDRHPRVTTSRPKHRIHSCSLG